MEHTENEGYKDEVGYTAWQSGYDAAMYDGMDLSSEMPCKCDACMKAYSEGEGTAIKELLINPKCSRTFCVLNVL